jgi:hypothetical protein
MQRLSLTAPNPGVTAWGDCPPTISVSAFDLKLMVIRGAYGREKGSCELTAFPAREWTDGNSEASFTNFIEFTNRATAIRSRSAPLTAVYSIADAGSRSSK